MVHILNCVVNPLNNTTEQPSCPNCSVAGGERSLIKLPKHILTPEPVSTYYL